MIFFVNPVSHSNIGDIAIFYATCKFLNNANLTYEVINQTNVTRYNITNTDTILLWGGGWLGIYDGPEVEWYLSFINTHRACKIIFMPSSFVPILDNYKQISTLDAIIYARDSISYRNYINAFPKATVKKIPDMVFYLDRRPREKAILPIGKFPRSDIESTTVLGRINGIPSESRYGNYINFDKYTLSNCVTEIVGLLNKIQKYSIIITDTLHVSIFAYLLHTPCIITDNLYGKLTNTWAQYDADCIFSYDSNKSFYDYKITNNHDIVFNYNTLLSDLIC